MEFGSEGVGVGEVRWGEGEVCRALKFWTPNFETTIQNLLQRSNSLLPLFRPLKNNPHIKKHGWGGDREKSDTKAI